MSKWWKADKKVAKEKHPTSKVVSTKVVTKPVIEKSYRNLQLIEKLIDKLDKIVTNNNKKDDQDEFHIFGKSVAIELRQLTLENALNLEEIQSFFGKNVYVFCIRPREIPPPKVRSIVI